MRLVDGDDVHGPTTAFQDCALATDTPLPKESRTCGARQPAPRAPVLQAIEERARTRKQALKLQDEIE